MRVFTFSLIGLSVNEIPREAMEVARYQSLRANENKEIIKRARRLAKPFCISKGKNFRLKDVDPNDTLEFTKEADKQERRRRWPRV